MAFRGVLGSPQKQASDLTSDPMLQTLLSLIGVGQMPDASDLVLPVGGMIRANKPGQATELMKKMRESGVDDLIDDLIKMGQKNPQKDTILNMRGSKVEPRLEDFLRR